MLKIKNDYYILKGKLSQLEEHKQNLTNILLFAPHTMSDIIFELQKLLQYTEKAIKDYTESLETISQQLKEYNKKYNGRNKKNV